MDESEKRLRRACFTGHRPEKLDISEKEAKSRLRSAIQKAINDGYATFISGMARGVDMWAAEIVLEEREENENIKVTITFNKIEPEYNHIFKDEYNLSFELSNDENFIELLNAFFSTYQEKKEQLNSETKAKISSPQYDRFIRDIAADTYKEYCKTGKIKDFYWDEISLRVAEMCKNCKDWVSEYSNDGITYPVYDTKISEIIRKTSGIAVFTTATFILAAISLSSNNPELLMEKEGFLATGAISSMAVAGISYKAAQTINKKHAYKCLDEIANRIEKKINIQKIFDGEILPQPRLTF